MVSLLPPPGGEVVDQLEGGLVTLGMRYPQVQIKKLGVTGEDIIRGSSNIPLSEKGLCEVAVIAKRFRAKGGVDRVHSSDLTRAKQTADAIARENGVAPVSVTYLLRPWMLGSFEGQPTKAVLDEMARYITRWPDRMPPGRGPMSTDDGESFNTFRRRFLNYLSQLMQDWENHPQRKNVAVTHYRGIKVIQAWLKAGMPNSLKVDGKEMLRHDGSPGTVYHFRPNGAGPWRLDEVNMADNKPLDGGIYVTRHGLTEWNGEN